MCLLLASVVAAVIGTYIVVRRMVFITGGIIHASFGGLGIGFWAGINPVLSAGVVAVLSALGVEWLSDKQRVREDSAIGVVWALGMAVGTIFIFLTPGYVPELNSFLFGNILTITTTDLVAIAIYLLVLLTLVILCYKKLVLSAFDADFGKTKSLCVSGVNAFGAIFVALGVVLMIRLVGVMLLISLITLPTMIAECFTRRLPCIIYSSALLSIVCAVTGLFISTIVSVPTSALIVIILVALYAFSKFITRQ